MNKAVAACALFIALSSWPAWAAPLDEPYAPTRAEWLEQAIASRLTSWMGAWRQRLAVMVVVRTASNEVVVTLTSANGESTLSERAQREYIDMARLHTTAVLERYQWAKGLRVTVQFV